jgi:quercetin dioxygenase-like cupin family protein
MSLRGLCQGLEGIIGICKEGEMNRISCLKVTGLIVCALLVKTVTAEALLETQTSWDGGKLAYPQGPVQITSFILRLEEGDLPRFHCHPVPTMGYVLKGRIKVETKDGNSATFEAGQSVVEVMRTVHRGTAVDGPVEIIVFYAGSTDLPTTVFPDDEAAVRHCKN